VVDAGYTSAPAYVQRQAVAGIQLLGPAVADSRWQARAGTGYATADFTLDWEQPRPISSIC